MNFKYSNIVFLIGIILFTGCVSHQQPSIANKIYIKNYTIIKAPHGINWNVRENPKGIVFGNKGTTKYDSYIAKVIYYPLEKNINNKQFINLVKSRLKAKNTIRFEDISSQYKILNRKTFICVNTDILLKDKEASIGYEKKSILLLKVKALYCKHKTNNSMFVADYSFRGKVVPQNFHKNAQLFLDGVKIIEKGKLFTPKS